MARGVAVVDGDAHVEGAGFSVGGGCFKRKLLVVLFSCLLVVSWWLLFLVSFCLWLLS